MRELRPPNLNKLYSYKEISIRLKNLRDSFCVEVYWASASLLYEVIAAWNLKGANAPKNLVCVTGAIRSAILSQRKRRCWNWNPRLV